MPFGAHILRRPWLGLARPKTGVVDLVAADAGVTKPTIYRRYKGKEELAVAALVVFCRHAIPPPTGHTRADLIAQMNHFRAGVRCRPPS